MDASTHTPALTNAGLIAMRAANMCKRLGLQARDAGTSKPAVRTQPARKQAPAPKHDAPETPESMRDWRVGVLVKAGEDAQTCVWVAVQAAGPRRASNSARAEARLAGHEPVGVCAVLRDDAPEALLKLAV